jgi:osmotically-inducible protein OsmY
MGGRRFSGGVEEKPMRYWICLGLALITCGCRKDADRLARVFTLATAKFEAMTGGVRSKLENGFEAARGKTGLDRRVAARLRWDKAMDGAEVRVLAVDSVLQLEGTVVSPEQQQRAVDLALATTGVEKVESKLTVRETK